MLCRHCTNMAILIGFKNEETVASVLARNSHFRSKCKITNSLTGDEPFDAFHAMSRAQEEFQMLKVRRYE